MCCALINPCWSGSNIWIFRKKCTLYGAGNWKMVRVVLCPDAILFFVSSRVYIPQLHPIIRISISEGLKKKTQHEIVCSFSRPRRRQQSKWLKRTQRDPKRFEAMPLLNHFQSCWGFLGSFEPSWISSRCGFRWMFLETFELRWAASGHLHPCLRLARDALVDIDDSIAVAGISISISRWFPISNSLQPFKW